MVTFSYLFICLLSARLIGYATTGGLSLNYTRIGLKIGQGSDLSRTPNTCTCSRVLEVNFEDEGKEKRTAAIDKDL